MFFSLYMLYDNEYITLIEESRIHIVSERLFLCSVSDSTSFCDLHIVALCILRTERKKKKRRKTASRMQLQYALQSCRIRYYRNVSRPVKHDY